MGSKQRCDFRGLVEEGAEGAWLMATSLGSWEVAMLLGTRDSKRRRHEAMCDLLSGIYHDGIAHECVVSISKWMTLPALIFMYASISDIWGLGTWEPILIYLNFRSVHTPQISGVCPDFCKCLRGPWLSCSLLYLAHQVHCNAWGFKKV